MFTVRPTANGETVQTMYGESPRNLHEVEIGSRLGVHPAAADDGAIADDTAAPRP